MNKKSSSPASVKALIFFLKYLLKCSEGDKGNNGVPMMQPEDENLEGSRTAGANGDKPRGCNVLWSMLLVLSFLFESKTN